MNIDDVKVILCDIDDTITTFDNGYNSNDYVAEIFTVFATALAEKEDISLGDAQTKIRAYADDLIWWDYPDFICDFGLPSVPAWKEIRKIHLEHMSFFDDAVVMIKALHKAGKEMCIISNNPLTGCLLKLEIAGLANLNGSKYFPRIFGTNILRGMKSQIPLWNRAIASLGVCPSEIITIGDSVKEDFVNPQTAGIGNTIIIDRSSDVAKEECNGYLKVNSLDLII